MAWLDVVKAVALPLVTLALGYWFNTSLNSRQTRDSNYRLYTEMMGRREQADSEKPQLLVTRVGTEAGRSFNAPNPTQPRSHRSMRSASLFEIMKQETGTLPIQSAPPNLGPRARSK